MEIANILETSSLFFVSFVLGLIGINSPQAHRPLIFLSLVFFALLAFRNVSNEKLGFEGTETIAMFAMIYISHMGCVLCIEKYVIPNKTSPMDLKAAYRMLFNARWLGTHRQAPDVHRNPKIEVDCEAGSPDSDNYSINFSKKSRSLIRSPRGIFLRNRIISFVTIITIFQVYNYSFFNLLPQVGLQLEMMDFLPSKQIYFRRLTTVTLRETVIRAWMVSYWVFYSVALYTALHDFFAFIFVSAGIDKPEDWPPLFGHIRDATSVRNFWGKTWHRLIYRSYTSYGKYISQHVLRLPRNSIYGKMFINFYVFAMSGLAHAISVRQLGFSCGFWEEIGFYCYSFLAILVEGVAITLFKKLTGGYQVNSTISKALGYAWVFMYLFTTLPKSQYPKLWCAPA